MALTARITSKDFYAEYTPNGAVAMHVQKLYFDSGVTGGTFKLEVNGEKTANITFSATPATFVTSINSALDALDGLGAGDIVASGTASTTITLTAIANKFYYIRVVDIALTPTSVVTPVTTEVTTQGSQTFAISADASSFEYSLETTMIDVTALGDYQNKEIPSREAMTFSLSLFDASQGFLVALQSPAPYGRFVIWDEGKKVGKRYMSFDAHISGFSKSFPDHEKVEITVDGARFGDWIVPPNTTYKG